jgi:hypothetical protein
MTTTQAAAINERIVSQHIHVIATGRVKSSGQRFFLIAGSTGATYTVLVQRGYLSCNCPAGQYSNTVCKHRMCAHNWMAAEVHESARSAAAQSMRRIRTGLADDHKPISIWK